MAKTVLPTDMFKIIMPPVFLLPLVAIPPDLPTGIFWFAGIVALVISVGKVTFLLLRGLWHFVKLGTWNFSIKRNLRSLLTIFVMVIAVISLSISNNRACKQTLGLAKYAQASCVENGICLKKIPTPGGTVGALIRYPVHYRTNQDLSEFSIIVRFNIDSNYLISGGVGRDLKKLPVF